MILWLLVQWLAETVCSQPSAAGEESPNTLFAWQWIMEIRHNESILPVVFVWAVTQWSPGHTCIHAATRLQIQSEWSDLKYASVSWGCPLGMHVDTKCEQSFVTSFSLENVKPRCAQSDRTVLGCYLPADPAPLLRGPWSRSPTPGSSWCTHPGPWY